MLVDEVHITVKSGEGGNGVVHFYHDKHRPKGGPDGGDGGKGGSVFFEAVSDISKLNQFRFPKVFSAPNGVPGARNNRRGANGEDLILKAPVGTIINFDNGTSIELTEVGQIEMIAKGGRGGYGNHHYRSSTNQTPLESTPGQKPLAKNLFLKLKLIAQVGLIGLPNAGKTSLLNEFTSADAKIANYPFTTLEPNLGVTKGGQIIADIPGLIEGASEGKGLGYKFLKHIEKTKIIVHCLSAESFDFKTDYKIVRTEMENYSSTLAEKKEILIITKSDLLPDGAAKKIQEELNPQAFVSIIDSDSIKKLSDLITKNLS